ncbi:MAG: porin family protein [Hyphomicrobiales bacterium]|nr:porin family protein [Hyphomicrobiales bacterium]
MGSLKALTFASTVALLAAGVASAADLPPPPAPMIEAPAAAPEFSGFYLRADVGAGINQLGGWRSSLLPFDYATGTIAAPGAGLIHQSIEPSALFGLGAGYQFNGWLRADLTGEYRTPATHYAAEAAFSAFCSTQASGYCLDTYRSRIRTGLFLANAYLDLGTWGGVTPYVGAGVGLANHRWENLVDGPYNGAAADKSQTNFAWALMAGVSTNVLPNVKLDFNYRYANMGRVSSNPVICRSNPCWLESQSAKIASHDFRVGLRYMFGDASVGPLVPAGAPIFGGAALPTPAPVVAPGPGPLVRKY